MTIDAFLLSIAFAATASAATDPLLVRLQDKLDRLQSLRARFVQTLDAEGLGRSRSEEGRLAFKKPSLMRWDYEKPEPKVALVDGRQTWLYVPGERQAHRGRLRDLEEEGAAALLLAGRMSLVKDFRSRRVAVEEAGPTGVAGGVSFELTPRRRADEFQRLILILDPERLQIRSLRITGQGGERMIFDLFDIEESPELPDALFRFEPPDGVEILDE